MSTFDDIKKATEEAERERQRALKKKTDKADTYARRLNDLINNLFVATKWPKELWRAEDKLSHDISFYFGEHGASCFIYFAFVEDGFSTGQFIKVSFATQDDVHNRPRFAVNTQWFHENQFDQLVKSFQRSAEEGFKSFNGVPR